MSLGHRPRSVRNVLNSALLVSGVVLIPAFVACSSDDSEDSPPGTDSGTDSRPDSGTDSGVDPTSAQAVRTFIGTQVGGIANLTVPADDDAIPVPPDDPARPGRYNTTPAKTYLGKLLFHDPVRTARININTGQPLDLPAGTTFGGTVSASEPGIDQIVAATRLTGSCGSCHIGEAAGKAGQLLNFNTGAGKAAGTQTRTVTSSPAVGLRRSSRGCAASPSSRATCWSMRSRP